MFVYDNKAVNNEVQKSALKLRPLLSLHRRMGIVSALFVILLSISGLVLHYSPSLRLDNRFLSSSVLLGWYGIEVPDITLGYSSADHRVSLIADALYFDGRRLPGDYFDLKGIVTANVGFAVATANQLILLTADGELVEVLGRVHGLPGGIEAIGNSQSGQIHLRHSAGILEADVDALDWTRSNIGDFEIEWSAISTEDPQTVEAIQADYASSLLSWERLILDIHSGRLLGRLGVVLVDIMAILFVLMAVTGVWIWTRRRS